MARTLHYLALALYAHGAWAGAAELSGSIYSSTGTLPAGIEILADPAKSQTPITGTVERGRYRITLPDTGLFRLRLVAKDWSAPPQIYRGPCQRWRARLPNLSGAVSGAGAGAGVAPHG